MSSIVSRIAVLAVVLALVIGLSAGLAAASPLTLMGVDVLTAAVKNANLTPRYTTTETASYYRLTDTDGVMEYREMTATDRKDFRKKQNEQYVEAVKAWAEIRAKWAKSMGSKPFPVSPPKEPTASSAGSIPTTDAARVKADEKHRRQIETYAVCVVKNSKGEKTAESIRQDKLYSKNVELQKEYVEAAIAWTDAHKDDKDKDKAEGAPSFPSITVAQSGIEGSDVASKINDKLAKKLQDEADKKAADDKAKDAAKDAAKNAGDKKPDNANKPAADNKDAVKEAL